MSAATPNHLAWLAAACFLWLGTAQAELAPWATAGSTSGSAALHPAWRLSGLPDNKAPRSVFEAVNLNGESVLALRTQAS
ncbi:MAG TPA: hypothetical protein VLQ47_04205, partial [Rhodoferax sp.]|nr:hypothetical protein [Rhodoferax sp.]